jgi:hypothetical protein
MLRHVFLIETALLVVLAGTSGCQQGGSFGGGRSQGGLDAEDQDPGDTTLTVTLGEDASVWWTEVLQCGEDDLIPYDVVFGSGQAEGHAELSDSQGEESLGLGYEISAPPNTESFAMEICGIRAEFRVEPDPTLSPDAIQAVLGSVVLDVQHLGMVGDSRNYEMAIVLSVSGGDPMQTLENEVIYCLADEFMYCWWDTPYIDVCRYEEAGCNEPYRAGAEELRVTDIMFQAGRTYHVDLEITGWISAIVGQPEQGGRIEFDFLEIDDPQILFGI